MPRKRVANALFRVANTIRGNKYYIINSDLTNVDITSQATINDQVVASYGDFKVYKYGKRIQVSLGSLKFLASGNAQNVITGLPHALCLCGCVPLGSNGANTASIIAAGDCAYIDKNTGTLKMHVGSTYNIDHYVVFDYLSV